MPAINDGVRAIRWVDGALELLDQRILPKQQVFIAFRDAPSVAIAIRDMVVRGAPAIGVAAAYAVVLAARNAYQQYGANWAAHVSSDLNTLAQSRPTAVNLFWALDRMQGLIDTLGSDNPEAKLFDEAINIHDEDIAANRHMGALGAELIDRGAVLTHCNTGSLATGGFGTALGVIRSAYAQGVINHVYADETRPWLQGARLTAWELVQDEVPVSLICEGAAASLMREGKVSWVVVGSDRIAANGDVANKIGTYSLAVLAKHHGVKFMVVAPTSTIDWAMPDGSGIPIEQRSPAEVLSCGGVQTAAEGAIAWNPAFDVTPAELVDAIVTQKGVVKSPSASRMLALKES